MSGHRPELDLFDTVCSRQGWNREGNLVVVPLPGGRHQRVLVEVVVDDDEEILRVRTQIGSAAVMNEARLLYALRMNMRLRHGAFAIEDDKLAMVNTLLLREADAAELEATILYLARKADEFERGLFGSDEH